MKLSTNTSSSTINTFLASVGLSIPAHLDELLEELLILLLFNGTCLADTRIDPKLITDSCDMTIELILFFVTFLYRSIAALIFYAELTDGWKLLVSWPVELMEESVIFLSLLYSKLNSSFDLSSGVILTNALNTGLIAFVCAGKSLALIGIKGISKLIVVPPPIFEYIFIYPFRFFESSEMMA